MSSEQTSEFMDDFDDISLTFWIILWTFLAVVASVIYIKLKGKPLREFQGETGREAKPADERIARKLVNEISRKDGLVKRTAFRRQRSYEIIDGEVRIHYDVPFVEGDERPSGENIVIAAEIESFPMHSLSIEDELELLLPGNLPRIVEEGEEFEEDEEEENKQNGIVEPDGLVKAVLVNSEENPADPNVVFTEVFTHFEPKLNTTNEVNLKTGSTAHATQNASKDNIKWTVEHHGKISQPATTQTSEDSGITNYAKEMANVPSESSQIEASPFGNLEKSSSDEFSSTSEENSSKSERILRSDNESMSSHSLNSTNESVYRLTEVEATKGQHFTVTRKTFKKLKSNAETKYYSEEDSDSKNLQTKCAEREENDVCVNTVNDLSCRDGSADNFNASSSSGGFVTSLNGAESAETNDQAAQDVVGIQIISQTTPVLKENELHLCDQPDVVNECQLTNKNVIINLEEETNLHLYCNPEASNSEFYHDDYENIRDFQTIDNIFLDNREFSESVEEFPLELNCIDNDLLIDDSGDVLFKVIGPSDSFLEDILEGNEFLSDGSLQVDENENYCEPELELSKNWKSLPSWEKAHDIQHRELDRDADDSDMESPNKAKDFVDVGHLEVVRSEEIIPSSSKLLEVQNAQCVQNAGEPELITRTSHGDILNVSENVFLESSEIVAEKDEPQEGILLTTEESEDVRVAKIVAIEDYHHKTEQSYNKDLDNVTSGEYLSNNDTLILTISDDTNISPSIATTNLSDDRTIYNNDKMISDDNVVLAHPCEVIANAQVLDKISHDSIGNNDYSIRDSKNTSCNNELPLIARGETKTTHNIEAKDVENEDLFNEDVVLASSCEVIANKQVLGENGYSDNMENKMYNNEHALDIASESCTTNAKLLDNTTIANRNNLPDKEVVVFALSKENQNESHAEPENEFEEEEESVIVAYASETVDDSDVVILASQVTEVIENQVSEVVASHVSEVVTENKEPKSYKHKPSTVQVLSHETIERKFTETSLDNNVEPSSPVRVTCVNKPAPKSPSPQETLIDTSDIDEIDIDNIDIPKEAGQKKSKSVTDLDEALANYGSMDSQLNSLDTTQSFDDASSISKSVPDNLDSCFKEILQETVIEASSDKASVESLPNNLQLKNLSVSSPDFAETQNSDKVKKITKIKIINVKFLEMQGDSGSENIEEDSFTIEGDKQITGKVKRRSGNFSPEFSPENSPNLEKGADEYATVKAQEKQLEFGINARPYTNLYVPLFSSAATKTEEPKRELKTAKHSPKNTIPQGRHVARYGIIKAQSADTNSPDNHSLKLNEKFQMGTNSNNKKKTAPTSSQPNAKQSASLSTSHPVRHKVKGSKAPKSRPKSSGHLVTIKSGLINDYYECSSDADSEMSYTSLSPPIRTKRMSHTMGHRDRDSASSSEPDSPRGRSVNGRSVSQRFGVESTKRPPDQNLFSRFHLQESEMKMNAGGHHTMLEANEPTTRFVEFNPFANVEGYDDIERSDSPTSVLSDTSSVFSFNCDFDPISMPDGSFNPEVYTCENPMCHNQDIQLGSEKTSYKSCPACFTYYCSSQCRKLHWPAHKQTCYFGRVNTYVRSIIRLCQHRQDLSMYLSQLARDGYHKKGRGVVMATFNSPELAREFITKGNDAFSGRNPTYSSLVELNREGVISKHRVALMQAVRDYEPNEEFVFNIAVVAVHNIPITPAPRYKLNTVLHCIKMPLNEKIVARRPMHTNKVESRLFALPKCSRHEFVNEMEARRHYCRNLSKNLRQYNIKLKEDYPECYKKLCMYVEHDITFEPMIVFGQRNNLTYKCIIAPEQNYALKAEYC